jgi:hypothetical protein
VGELEIRRFIAEVDISKVEVIISIFVVKSYSLLEGCFRFVHLSLVVLGQSFVFEVK